MNTHRLRHSTVSRLVRRGLYQHFVGPGGPLRFRRGRTTPAGSPAPEPPAANLYFHLPFCRTLCAYCPYLKTRHEPDLAAAYTRALLAETRAWLAASPDRMLDAVYFGGGTPFLLLPAIEQILTLLAPRLTPQTALGLELHPADVTTATTSVLRARGFDRVSLGAESLHTDTLRRLGRSTAPEQILRSVDTLLAAGFRCVDTNLIYGIGDQTTGELLADAAVLLDRGVHQISAYPLLPFRHTRRAVLASVRTLLHRDRAARALRRLCLARGLQPTSVWSFNRPGRPTYTTVTLETFRGFGAGAASRSLDGFRFNTFDIAAYTAPDGQHPALVLEADPRFHRAHWLYWKIYQLRVPVDDYHKCFGSEPEADFPRLFGWLRRLGIAQREGKDWFVKPRGADWIHRVQQLYSLSWIDLFWGHCLQKPWPEEIVLE